MITNGKHK